MAPVVFLSIPGLRAQDLQQMSSVRDWLPDREDRTLIPSFPCVTWPVQTNFITGKLARDHGIVANGFFWRDRGVVEMWTAGNAAITSEQIWDSLHQDASPRTSAVWFPMLSKESGADFVCMPAPIHNPDGSESLWCYTKPKEFYGELLERFGQFPLQHFWGPLANIESSKWIAQSSVFAFDKFHPDFFFIYLPHLDYAAQKFGPESEQAAAAVVELDAVLAELMAGICKSSEQPPIWIVAGEYAITEVSSVVYPNRILRDSGWLTIRNEDGLEYLETKASDAWALVDHQCGHVFVRDTSESQVAKVAQLFEKCEGIAEVLVGTARDKYGLDHPRAGEVVLVSTPESWQAYYWWESDALAPKFARNVDIHQKPGYDPVELFFDPVAKGIPLDASLVRGSHGAPVTTPQQETTVACSRAGLLGDASLRDTDMADLIRRALAVSS